MTRRSAKPLINPEKPVFESPLAVSLSKFDCRQNSPCQRDGPCPSDQQAILFLQHTIGPLGAGQCTNVHPVGQLKILLSVAALLAFFLWAFLGDSLPAWAAGAELATAGSLAGAVGSAAHAGAAKIKADNNNRFFIFMVTLPLWLKNITAYLAHY